MSFDHLGLSPALLMAVKTAGYSEPTPIQEQAIPAAVEGRDILGIAQTGTGKTASFTLPMIERLARGRAKARMPRSLILEPTRELAAQVSENFETYGRNHKLSMALLIGGVSFDEQERKLDRGVDVLIATPGRLIDHFERGKVMLNGVQILVVDEADRMLDMGFIPDIERIVKMTPFTRQTLFFSATMPKEIQHLTDQFLQNPKRVEVARPSSTTETVKQSVVKVSNEPKSKRESLRQLVGEFDVKNAIVFCNRKRDVAIVARSLSKHGFNAAPLHGDLAQSIRMETLGKFRDGDVKLLVASDVAARGLDIPAVSHVFNYDVPTHAEDYVHRIGRTGRAGRSGAAITLATRQDGKYLSAIEQLIKKEIEVRKIDAAETTDEVVEPDKKESRKSSGRQDKSKHSRAKRDDQAPKGKDKRGNNEKAKTVGLGDHVPAFLLKPVVLNSKVA